MFEFAKTEVEFLSKEQFEPQRVQFTLPYIPTMAKREKYAIFTLPDCLQIFVTPEEEFFRMIDEIDSDIRHTEKQLTSFKNDSEQAAIKRKIANLRNERHALMTNKFEFIYRGSNYPTTIVLPALFLEYIGIDRENCVMNVAYNVKSGEVFFVSERDKWQIDYAGEDDYDNERSLGSIIMKRFAG